MLGRAVFGVCSIVIALCVFRAVVAQCPYQKADDAACPQSPNIWCPETNSILLCMGSNAREANVGPFACASNGENATWCGNRCAVAYCTIGYACAPSSSGLDWTCVSTGQGTEMDPVPAKETEACQ